MRKAIYPGTFDPITYGHIDVIKRALRMFDKVVIAVADNPEKTPLFTLKERLAMLKEATNGLKGITLDNFDCSLVEYARAKGMHIIVRGIRMVSDFEYEFQMALTNRKLDDKIETIFLMPGPDYSYLSSRLIKELAALGQDVKSFVPAFVAKRLKEKLSGCRT